MQRSNAEQSSRNVELGKVVQEEGAISRLGKNAVDRLVEENQRIVRHVLVKRGIMPDDSQYDDLFSEGLLYLFLAAQKYDPAKGSFISYAISSVRGGISNKRMRDFSLTKMGTTKWQRQLYSLLGKHLAGRIPESELSVDATTEDFADYLGLPVDQVREMRIRFSGDRHLDSPLADNGGGTLYDIVQGPSPNAEESLQNSGQFVRAIYEEHKDCLSPLQQQVIEARYLSGDPVPTYREVGEGIISPKTGKPVTKQYIEQLEKAAIRRLQKVARDQ